MTEANETDANEHEQKRLTLRSGGTLGLRRPPEGGQQVRQSFSHGRSKAVTVEVRKKRVVAPGAAEPSRGEAASSVPATARRATPRHRPRAVVPPLVLPPARPAPAAP